MPKKEIEKIVLATGDKAVDYYAVAITFDKGFSERYIGGSLDLLKTYLLGLIDSGKYTSDQVKNMRSFRKGEKQPDYFYIGLPLKRKEFQEVKDYITAQTKDNNHDGNFC